MQDERQSSRPPAGNAAAPPGAHRPVRCTTHHRKQPVPSVQLSHRDGVYAAEAARYRLVTHADRPFVTLAAPDGSTIAEPFVASSAHSTCGPDDTTALGPWQARAEGD